MPKRLPKDVASKLLSPLSGGINRFEQEAGNTQAVDALDVIYRDGDLSRRPAFKTIQISGPFFLPCNYITVATRLGGSGAYTTQANRVFTVSSWNEFFIGCDEQFDGIDLSYITRTGFTAATRCYAELSYSIGNDSWAEMPLTAFFDWTRYREGVTAYSQPLSRDGKIAWHRPKFDIGQTNTDPWVLSTFSGLASGVSKYWIRIRIRVKTGGPPSTPTDALATLATTVTLSAPGVRAFQLNPVNFLDYRRFKNGREGLYIGSDRTTKQVYELGAMLATPGCNGQASKELTLVEDEGPGVLGQTTWPEWQQAGVNQGAPATPTYGTSNVLTKNQTEGFYFDGTIGRKRQYLWLADATNNPPQQQFKGTMLHATVLTPTAAAAGSIQVSDLSVPDNYYQNCRLRVTAKGAGGSAVGEEREIYKVTTSGGTTTIYFYDAFTTTPDTNNRFAILSPNSIFRTRKSVREYEVSSNGQHTLTPVLSRPFAASSIATEDANQPCNFEVGKPTRYSIPAGERWSSVYIPDTNELFLSNGESGLLSFDGNRLRKVVPDNSSILAKQLSGELVDKAKDDKDPQPYAKGLLSSHIPNAKYLTDWNGHIALAGLDGRPTGYCYSLPGGANRIFPLLYFGQIRDGLNLPISGIGSLDGSPLAWTPGSIHFGTFDELGSLSFRPISTGLGFINHHAVCKVPIEGANYLLGPNADGIYATNGTNVIPILDRWDRIIKGGCNKRALSKSCACYLASEGYYVLAFPSAGSDYNDRIAIYDVNRKAWWLWSIRFGASALTTVFDNKGFERILIGTNEGHIMTLADADVDDGYVVGELDTSRIQGYATTAPITLAGDYSVSVNALMITACNPYPPEDEARALSVSLLLNKRPTAWQTGNPPLDQGQDNFADEAGLGLSGNGPVFGTAIFSARELVTKRLNAKLGSNCHYFQVKFQGSGKWALRSLSVEYTPKARR